MNEKEITELVERKILEAKLDISDKRLNFLILIAGGLLAVFGIIVPIWQANTSTDKVDKALNEMKQDLKSISQSNLSQIDRYEDKIDNISKDASSRMKEFAESQNNYLKYSSDRIDKEILSFENKFKELAGTQLRKPIIVCRYNGNILENSTLGFNLKNRMALLEFKNIGDATAKNIRIRVYLNTNKSVHLSGSFGQQDFSDEPSFNKVYDYYLDNTNSLDPKDSNPINIYLETELKESLIIPAMMKIYYEQPDPAKYNFTIKYDYK